MNKIKLALIFALFVSFTMVAKNPQNYYANKAEEAIAAGNYEDALDYARQEIYDYGKNANGYYQASLSLYGLNQPGQALTMINKAIDLAKKNKTLGAHCYWAKAEILRVTGDSIQANKALETAVKLDPKNVDLVLDYVSNITESDPQRALKELEKAKKLSPNDPRCYAQGAWIYSLQDNYKSALEEITKALNIEKSSYNYGMRGYILKNLGYTPDWIKDCLKSVELAEEGETGLGTYVLVEAEDEATRRKIINEIGKLRTPSNGYYALEGNLLYVWGNYQEAAKVFQEMINLGITDATIYGYLASSQKEAGDLLGSFATVSSGLFKYPDNQALKYTKSEIGVECGKGAEVMDLINGLIYEMPEVADVYVLKGEAYMSLGKYKEAVEPFATAVILNPSAKNKMYYGDALRMSGENTKAASEYRDILAKSEEEITNEGSSPQYFYAMAYSGLGKRNEAINCINKLEGISAEDKSGLLAVNYARLGYKSDAIGALKTFALNTDGISIGNLYDYNFHSLHSEPEFVNLFAENGIHTTYNSVTKLLEYEPEKLSFSSGGISIEEAQKSINPNGSWIAQLNSMCPIDFGMLGQLKSVELDEKNHSVIYNIVTNPGIMDYEELNHNSTYKQKKEDVIATGFMRMADDLIANDVTFVYNLRASDNSGSTRFTITPKKFKELKRKSLSQDEMDKMALELWVEESNIENRKNQGQSELSRLEGKKWIFVIPTSEEDGSLASIELFKTEVKKSIASTFSDAGTRRRLPVLVRQNMGMLFIYQGLTTGKTVEVEFTPEELKAYI